MNYPNFNPPAPGPLNIRTFQDVKNTLTFIVNQWMQYVNNYVGNQMLPSLNGQVISQPLVSAAAITPVTSVHQITGSTPISTINPMPGAAGQVSAPFYAIAQDGFTTTTTGNIAQAVTVAAGHMAIFAYHPAQGKWSVVTS